MNKCSFFIIIFDKIIQYARNRQIRSSKWLVIIKMKFDHLNNMFMNSIYRG